MAALIYGVGLIALFSVSALYHRWPGDPRWKPWLRRMDHSTIFVFIAASYTPVGLLVLDGTVQIVVLVSVWSGRAGGHRDERGLDLRPPVAAGAHLPARRLGGRPRAPAARGTRPASRRSCCSPSAAGSTRSGAVVYALRRPNLWPRTYGFHEVFHTLVIAAAVVHFVAMAGWVVPSAG